MAREFTQLTFDLGALGLRVEPTVAMRRGEQQIFQHSNCGTVVVRSSLDQTGDRLGPCPSCTKPNEPWWNQPNITHTSGVSGLRLITENEARS